MKKGLLISFCLLNHLLTAVPAAVNPVKQLLFMSAAQDGDLALVSQMLEEGASVNLPDRDSMTALMHACQRGHTNIVTFLIDHGAQVNAVTNSGWTPLMYAAFTGRPEIVRILRENNANVAAQNNEGNSAINLAENDETRAALEEPLAELVGNDAVAAL